MTASFDNTILKYFSSLEDPRIERTRQHQLVDIVAIAILAVISGADSWVAIETYAQSKREWLETFLLWLFMDSRDLKFRWQRRGYNTDSD